MIVNSLEELKEIRKNIMADDNIRDETKMYCIILGYKQSINNIIKHNLQGDVTKEELQNDLNELARHVLKNTNKSYKTIEEENRRCITNDYIACPNEIDVTI